MAFEQRVKIILETVTGNAKKGIEDFKSSVSDAETHTGKFRAGIGSLASSFASAATSPLGITAGIGAAVGVAGKAIGEFESLGLSVGKFSDATGIAAPESSRLIEVFNDLGVSTEQAQGAIGKMEKALGANKDAFKQYGIEVVKAKDGTVDANATFIGAIDSLNAIKNPTERATAANAVFGKSWASMAELINGGSAKLRSSLESVQPSKVLGAKDVAAARDLRDGFDSIKDAGEGLFLTLGKALAPAISALAPQIGKVIAAAGPLVGLIGERLAGAFKTLAPVIEVSTKAIGLFAKGVDLASQSGSQWLDISDAIHQHGAGDEEFGRAETAADKLHGSFSALAGANHELTVGFEDALSAAETQAAAHNNLSVESQTLANSLIHADDAAAEAVKAHDDLTESLKREKDATEATKKANEELITQLRTAADADLNVADKTNAYHDSLTDVVEAEKDHKLSAEDLQAVYRDNVRAAADLADAQVRQREETDKANGATTSATTKQDLFNQSLLASANDATPKAKQAIYDYIGQVNDIPPEKMTEIQAMIDAGDLAGAIKALDDASKARTAAVNVDVNSTDVQRVNGILADLSKDRIVQIRVGANGSVPRFASGTSSAPSGVALVGEKGPELVELFGGERIHSASATDALIGHGTPVGGAVVVQNFTINVHTLTGKLSPRDVDYIRNEIAGGNRRNGLSAVS